MIKIKYGTLHVALPALDELDYLPATLTSLQKQKLKNFVIHVCINQPNDWWNDDEKKEVCQRNQKTIEYVRSHGGANVIVYDKSSQGLGWIGKHGGVGWARKFLMDAIAKTAEPNDIIVCADADTIYDPNYLKSIYNAFAKYSEIVAISAPYYHELNENIELDRSILRYEIYMRYYLINLYRIRSPYAFTALGSAMSVPVWVYKTVSGITPKKSGEDFYFLQKLRKYGFILNWLPEIVKPAARQSERVEFGTGPAIIKGLKNDWDSYPIYHFGLFDEILETYNMIPRLFERDLETPVTYFLQQQFDEEDIWTPLRNNFKSTELFTKAFHEKFDGLRILQYLKQKNNFSKLTDEEKLTVFLKKLLSEKDYKKFEPILNTLSFKYSGVYELNKIRDLLNIIETRYRKNDIPE